MEEINLGTAALTLDMCCSKLIVQYEDNIR